MTSSAPSFERVLITNDDGIAASGLALLEEIAAGLAREIWVVAPETEQSASGHSLTLTEPTRIRQVGERRFSVRGTPTDCVMLAVNHIMKEARPSLVLSGVNRGINLGEDVTYSGTVAAAFEGTLAGIPSIALSQERVAGQSSADWQVARDHAPALVEDLVSRGWPEGVCLNVNFPAANSGPVRGIKITRQGRRDLKGLRVEERRDLRGFAYYWFNLQRDCHTSPEGTDLWAIQNRWISVTPLHLDLTHAETLDLLKAHNSEG